MRLIFRLGGLIALYAIAFPTHAETGKIAPIHFARSSGNAPMMDSQGRIYCIVDLAADAHEGFDDVVAAETSPRFHPRHSAKAQNMVAAYEKRYGFQHVNMTSWVGNSFSAYLTQQQVDELRDDPRRSRAGEFPLQRPRRDRE